MKPTYTPADAGCYVDGARGIYSVDAIVDFARDHGAIIIHNCGETCDESAEEFATFSNCEFAGEYEDDVDSFMNDRYPVDGHYWGRSEAGDWGLWPCEED